MTKLSSYQKLKRENEALKIDIHNLVENKKLKAITELRPVSFYGFKKTGWMGEHRRMGNTHYN